jgi:hypothetical protein
MWLADKAMVEMPLRFLCEYLASAYWNEWNDGEVETG